MQTEIEEQKTKIEQVNTECKYPLECTVCCKGHILFDYKNELFLCNKCFVVHE